MKTVLNSLDKIKTKQEKFNYLGEQYPCLLIFLLKKMGEKQLLENYMSHCKSYESDIDDYENYSLYVHGYFLPWLQE